MKFVEVSKSLMTDERLMGYDRLIAKYERDVTLISRSNVNAISALLWLAGLAVDCSHRLWSYRQRAREVFRLYVEHFVIMFDLSDDSHIAALAGQPPFDSFESGELHRFRKSDLERRRNGLIVMLPTCWFRYNSGMSASGRYESDDLTEPKRVSLKQFTDLIADFYPERSIYVTNGLYADIALDANGNVIYDTDDDRRPQPLFVVRGYHSQTLLASRLFYEWDGYRYVKGKMAYPRLRNASTGFEEPMKIDFATYTGGLPTSPYMTKEGKLSFSVDLTGSHMPLARLEFLVWMLHFHCYELDERVSTFRRWCRADKLHI